MTVSDWVVACPDSLETLLIQELQELGVTDCTRATGAVLVKASLAQAYRICLWSRLATRVFKPLFEVEGNEPEAMYAAARAFSWGGVFPHHKTFAIRAVAVKGVATHTQYMALKLKDAIADHFREHHGSRPDVRVQEPDVALHVLVRAEGVTVSLDMSGESLHRRGYRTQIGEAPLKETLAAAILRQAGWPDGRFEALLDPMCGSGTFLTEAALMFGDVAPGLHRNYYGFLGWVGHDAALWRELLDEARQRELAGRDKPWPRICGYDADRDALQAALKNAHAAGLSSRIELEHRELWKLPQAPVKLGLLITNPPYGERIGDAETTLWLYRAVGRLARERLPGWQAAVLAADITHADALGFQHRDTQRLRNGDLTVFVRHGDVQPAAGERVHLFTSQLADIPPEGEAFANRLLKNQTQAYKQALREDTGCYRVYDADLPDFNLAIDVYGDCLHVQEYAAPKEIDPAKAAARFKLALNVARQVFGVHKEKVFLKVRTQQRGNQQYEKQSDRGRLQDVREGRAHLLVNLTDYLDTGLFLDHRPMRLKIAAEVQGKSFLNLFAYTGTVSVHAALGGARQTTTVDLSGNYLDWARKNFAINGISPANHHFEEADVLQWLRRSRETFDVIFIDPPTFSNSKKMRDDFDIQRDHVELLTLAMRHLKPDGVCYFSNNYRRFELDGQALQSYAVDDISPATIGFDFRRNDRIHRCWRIRHSESSVASIVREGFRENDYRDHRDREGRSGDRRERGAEGRRDFRQERSGGFGERQANRRHDPRPDFAEQRHASAEVRRYPADESRRRRDESPMRVADGENGRPMRNGAPPREERGAPNRAVGNPRFQGTDYVKAERPARFGRADENPRGTARDRMPVAEGRPEGARSPRPPRRDGAAFPDRTPSTPGRERGRPSTQWDGERGQTRPARDLSQEAGKRKYGGDEDGKRAGDRVSRREDEPGSRGRRGRFDA